MIISDIEAKDVLYDFIKKSDLSASVDGGLYKDARPLNSDKEDIVIAVIARDAKQLQEFIVNVNIFVADMKRGSEFIENTNRLRTIAKDCIELFSHRCFERYNLYLDSQTIMAVDSKDAHCINNRLTVKFFSED